MVVFNREIFFGQGILEASPGTTHHGQPFQVIECGATEIDQSTFQEYLSSLQEMYTPEAYHLIEFNCNHFTADLVGFLTGGSIPSWISGQSHFSVAGSHTGVLPETRIAVRDNARGKRDSVMARPRGLSAMKKGETLTMLRFLVHRPAAGVPIDAFRTGHATPNRRYVPPHIPL